jgi:hypothetical protein
MSFGGHGFPRLEAYLEVVSRLRNSPAIIDGNGLFRLSIRSYGACKFSVQFQYWVAKWFDRHGIEAIERLSD